MLTYWIAVAGAVSALSSPLQFQTKGKPVASWERAEIEKKTAPAELEVWEPHEKKLVTYRGYYFEPLLTAAYGEAWKKQEEILFTCSDGYQPSIPVDRFLKRRAFLAFARAGSDSFELTNTLQGDERVKLGPYYLVWDNAKLEDREALGATGWPYQLEKVDLVRFSDRFPQMAPPPGSGAAVTQGFAAFREQCANCHSVNGDGGLKGIELNYPVSVTEYWKRKWLKQWILDPQKMRLKTAMPALNQGLSDRLKIADQIVAYLEAMAKVKKAPKEVTQ
jgi:mono/diheme cytochrome c family protein